MNLAIRLAVAGTVSLTAALATWSVGGDPPEADASRERISGMPQAERDRVKRAHDEFRRMQPAERESIRRLHEAVAKDPSLEQTLLDYEAFLDTLQPWEREELRQEADVAKRMAKVRKLVAERAPRESPGRAPWLAGRFVDGPVLPPPQLDRAMKLLAESLDLPVTQKQELLAKLPDHVRHLEILKLAEPKLTSERSKNRWPDDETVRAILKLRENDEFMSRLLREDPSGNGGDRERQEFRRTVAAGLVSRSLLSEWHEAVYGSISRDDLRKAFEQLPEADRNQLAERPRGELIRTVVREVLVKREGEVGAFARQFKEVFDLRAKLDPYFSRRRGPGPPMRGPGGDDRNDERHEDGRRDEERRSDGRRGGPDRDDARDHDRRD